MPTLIAMRSFLQQLAYLLRDIIGRKTKMREYVGRLAGSAEAVDAEHATGVTHVTPPALGRTRLHRPAGRRVSARGRTLSRYAASCASNASVEGIDTRRTRRPAAFAAVTACAAMPTSEP